MRQPGPPLTAFWCERVVYEAFAPDSKAHVSRCSRPNPAEAVRAIRVDVRALQGTLAPVERERALRWTGPGGSLGAVAALYRGEPCGFSLSSEGRWLEWTVRPYLVFDVSDLSAPALTGRACRQQASAPAGGNPGQVVWPGRMTNP